MKTIESDRAGINPSWGASWTLCFLFWLRVETEQKLGKISSPIPCGVCIGGRRK
jgi:hypothetical protein